MEISEYRNIFDNEGSHFYYVGTHNSVIEFLNKYLPKKTGNVILDAGCGTGSLMKKLKKFGKIYGIDVSNEALKFARVNGLKLAKLASVTDIPYKDNQFDALVSIDVLYHKQVKNDLQALNEFKRVLKPGGILIIKNPAHNWLRGKHDVIIHTKRRYGKEEFRKKLKKANLSVIKLSYINLFFFPFAIVKRVFENLSKKNSESDVQRLPPFLNKCLIRIYNLEVKWLIKTEIPFGLSLFAIARKSKLKIPKANRIL